MFISLLVLEAILNMRYGDCLLQILSSEQKIKMEVLSLCSRPVLDWQAAPLGIFQFVVFFLVATV
jgi:hypothetical protein